MKRVLILAISLLISLQGSAQTKTEQNQNKGKNIIVITHVPKYNTFGFVEGKIIGDLNTKESRIASYLYSEDGGGYFNKPYWVSPTVEISENFTFSVDVTTGGTDEKATAYVFFLVPATYKPPILRGEKIPEELYRKFQFIEIKRVSK
jgi:hypothetical protein